MTTGPVSDLLLQLHLVVLRVPGQQLGVLHVNQRQHGKYKIWSGKFMNFKIEAHQVERLNSHPVAICRVTELEAMQFRLVSIRVLPAELLRLENLVSKVRGLMCDKYVPEPNCEIEPEKQGVW